MHLDRGLLLGFVGVLLLVSLMLVVPYVQFVLAAVILGFVLQPLQRQFSQRFGPTLSAAILVVLSLVAIVLPLVVIAARVASDAVAFAQGVQAYEVDYQAIEAWIADATGQSVDVQNAVESAGQNFADSLFETTMSAVGTVTHLLLGLGLFVFLLYFFVRDGHKFAAWIRDVSPLPNPVTADLLDRINGITRAVLAGHVLVALVQGVLAGIGLAVVGIPNAAFWTFVMVLLALIPLIGTFVVWGPASVVLYLGGRPMAAVALAVYGAVVVGVSDDYLRPIFTDRYAHVSPAVIIVGVVGGMSAFGFMGLFLGPIVVAVLKESIEVYAKYYGKEAEPTDEEPSAAARPDEGTPAERSDDEQSAAGADETHPADESGEVPSEPRSGLGSPTDRSGGEPSPTDRSDGPSSPDRSGG